MSDCVFVDDCLGHCFALNCRLHIGHFNLEYFNAVDLQTSTNLNLNSYGGHLGIKLNGNLLFKTVYKGGGGLGVIEKIHCSKELKEHLTVFPYIAMLNIPPPQV